MKKIFKKNQIIVTLLAVLIAVAGYLNYTYNGETEDDTIASANADVSQQETEIGEAVLTNGTTVESYIAQAKLSKEQTRSKNEETLLGVINNESVSEDEKEKAINTMVEITENAELETAVENLLLAKGLTQVVVTISNGQVEVVVNENELSDTIRVQIEDIVKRKTNVDIENIIITPTNNQ